MSNSNDGGTLSKRWRGSGLGLLLLVALAIWSSVLVRPSADGLLSLTALNVGQGDALLISTPHGRQVLVDAGPDDTVVSELDAVLPLTYRRIDLAVVSHNHSDHIGGFAAVLRQYPVAEFWLSGAIHTTKTYLDLVGTIKTERIPTTAVTAGTTTVLDGVRLTVLYPLTPHVGELPENQHDQSIVLLVEYGNRSLLLTGDLEAEHEAEILASGLISHPVDVLKVGHHGSNTSTSEAWLAAIQPSIGIISVGRRNTFHHPHPTVIDRLTSHGVTVLRTDEDGRIRVATDGSQLWTETER